MYKQGDYNLVVIRKSFLYKIQDAFVYISPAKTFHRQKYYKTTKDTKLNSHILRYLQGG